MRRARFPPRPIGATDNDVPRPGFEGGCASVDHRRTTVRLNTYEDWSPLREIIVGSATNYTSHDREMSFELYFHDNIHGNSGLYIPRLDPHSGGDPVGRSPIKDRYLEELNEDIDGLVETLESLSVKVLRPLEKDALLGDVRTPAWSASVVPPLNVRDNTLIVGDEIIETPPMIRSRYFETQFLTPHFAEYFRLGARWTVMPRPLMTDASFDLSYAAGNPNKRGPVEPVQSPGVSPYDVGYEMMFDGAQCLRLGRDVMVNIANRNHEIAVEWLERHLEGRFRLHRVYRLSDSHIDSMVLALRPGLLLVRSDAVADQLPAKLQSWDRIVAPAPARNNFPAYEDDDLVLTSPYIDLNVLSIDENTVLVNEASPELMRTLEHHGFTTVPVRHRHRRLFGGGFHCFTLDTVRAGGAEDYLG